MPKLSVDDNGLFKLAGSDTTYDITKPDQKEALYTAYMDSLNKSLSTAFGGKVVATYDNGTLSFQGSTYDPTDELVINCDAGLALGIGTTATSYLSTGKTLEEAIASLQQSSRRYAKRQLTWFKRNPQVRWLRRDAGTTGEEILSLARQALNNFDK